MREIRFDRKKAYIAEKAWKSLLRRFDEKNAVRDREGWVVEVPCILCKSFRRYGSCRKCPLFVFKKDETVGCVRLIEGLIHWEHNKLIMSPEKIYWSFENDRTARHQLRKIHEALLGLPKVKKRK